MLPTSWGFPHFSPAKSDSLLAEQTKNRGEVSRGRAEELDPSSVSVFLGVPGHKRGDYPQKKRPIRGV